MNFLCIAHLPFPYVLLQFSVKWFVDQDCMSGIRSRATFIHVDIPGQEEDAQDVANFPSMEALGGAIGNILDNFNVSAAVGLGEGAGAKRCIVDWICMKSTHSIQRHKSLSHELRSEGASERMNERSGARERSKQYGLRSKRTSKRCERTREQRS